MYKFTFAPGSTQTVAADDYTSARRKLYGGLGGHRVPTATKVEKIEHVDQEEVRARCVAAYRRMKK